MNEFARKAMELADAWVVAAAHKVLSVHTSIPTDANPAAARAALVAHLEGVEQKWLPMDTAPKVVGRIIGCVDGRARFICWGKASHVPMYGWVLTDQGVEDCDLCNPTGWMPLPATPTEEQSQ